MLVINFFFFLLFSSLLFSSSLLFLLRRSLNKNGVTPSGDAHRITKKADLKKLGLTAGGKVKAEGTVDEAGEGALSFPEIDAALESVKAALGSSPTL